MSSIATLRRPQHRRIAAWLALTAVLFQALWPALVNAQRPDSIAPFEVCTAQGLRADAGQPTGSGGHSPGGLIPSGHCALCVTGTLDLPAIHQTGLTVPAAAIADTENRRADRFSLRVPIVRISARPRDPPIDS